VKVPSLLVRKVVAFLNPNTVQQVTETKNEDVAQQSQIIYEA
jgi:hypothetical protein